MFGALFEVELRKICTTSARESDFCEKKKGTALRVRSTFGSSALQNLRHVCARERLLQKKAPRCMFGALLEVELRKICTTPARESDFCKTKAPRCMFGALLEVVLRKICTTPARESDLEVKTVKAPSARDVFGGSKCFLRGRRRDFDTLQNTRQAQEFARVAKTLAGVADLKRLRNDAFRVAGARISCFVMSMFEVSVAQSVERLQISCYGNVT